MRYQLRYAAGVYWLLDTWQEGVPYKRPFTMNEVGAAIWRMMEQGYSRDHIADVLSKEYQTAIEIVEKDIEQFRLQLVKFGIGETEKSELSDGNRKGET